MKMKINIEHVRKIQEERKKINSVPLEQIEWYENGIKVDINPETITDFLCTELNNIDFIISNIYRHKGQIQVISDIRTKEFIKQIKSLRKNGKTKTQCKKFAFRELEKKENNGSMSKFWPERDRIIEAIFL